MSTFFWMIHKRLSGDSSVQVLFFCREKGLVSALYKGGRTPKKQALLQAFTPLWVDVTTRHHWHYVTTLEIAAPSLPLSRDNLYAALYINELLYHTLRPEDPHPTLYDAYVEALQALSQSTHRQDLERVLRRFEWTLLVAIGYGISLTHDAQTAAPIAPDRYYTLRTGQGFVQTERGILGAYVLALSRDELGALEHLKVAKFIMRQLIDVALGGKDITARAFFKTIDSIEGRA